MTWSVIVVTSSVFEINRIFSVNCSLIALSLFTLIVLSSTPITSATAISQTSSSTIYLTTLSPRIRWKSVMQCEKRWKCFVVFTTITVIYFFSSGFFWNKTYCERINLAIHSWHTFPSWEKVMEAWRKRCRYSDNQIWFGNRSFSILQMLSQKLDFLNMILDVMFRLKLVIQIKSMKTL